MERFSFPNQENMRLIGEGAQGKVYQIDSQYCMKIYKKSHFLRRELACLRRGEGEAIFPKVFEWNRRIMIREYIPGEPLSEYLKTHPLTGALAMQLLDIYRTLERLKFKRLDMRLEHIIVTPGNQLRIIDPTNLMNESENYPRRMLIGLDTLGCKRAFLKYIWEKEPRLAEKWDTKEFWRKFGDGLDKVWHQLWP